MEAQAAPDPQSYEDVRKSGYLRKQKSLHRRFFVLRAASDRGPARLEYYENEKKFRSKSPVPKKVVHLESCFNINKRADSKNKHLIVLYTRGESFAVAADTEQAQNDWFQAMVELQCRSKPPLHPPIHCPVLSVPTVPKVSKPPILLHEIACNYYYYYHRCNAWCFGAGVPSYSFVLSLSAMLKV